VSQSATVLAAQTSSVRIATEQHEAVAGDGERKTVTALFADIKGSTELMRDLDPEEARALFDPVLRLMMEAVHRYDRSGIVGSPRRQFWPRRGAAASFAGGGGAQCPVWISSKIVALTARGPLFRKVPVKLG
jgi:hypothetical protein